MAKITKVWEKVEVDKDEDTQTVTRLYMLKSKVLGTQHILKTQGWSHSVGGVFFDLDYERYEIVDVAAVKQESVVEDTVARIGVNNRVVNVSNYLVGMA